jgi:outer membrane protein assembly factor BamB
VAINSQGIVHVANIGAIPSRIGKDIYQITPDGQATLWVSGQGLLGASGNTFDADGNLIQSSLTGNVIHRITPDGTITELVREGIHGPVGVVLATDGTLFVANCSGSSIQRVLPDGTSTPLAKDSQLFRCPNGITLDESGNVYVSNFRNGMIFKVTTNGKITPLAELPGGNNAHLTYMNGLLYVVDRGNHQIYTVTLDGETTLFAGTGERGHQDGPALQATFSLPNDIVFSTDGHHLYLNEVSPTKGSNNNPSAVRVIELPREE